jgi:hypothetical protein
MDAASLTCYSVSLFLALCALMAWTNRRYRLSNRYRQAVGEVLIDAHPTRPYVVS